MKKILILLCVLVFAGCSRRSLTGTYHTVGDEDKFRMSLDVRDNGQATCAIQSNLGNSELDKALQAKMSIAGRWIQDRNTLVVTGVQAEGKQTTYRFVLQPNGDLIWDQNGARFVKAK